MKKGCFILVILLPVSIGILYYIIDKYGFNFWEKSNLISVESILDSIEEKIKELPESDYSDSVKVSIENYFSNLRINDTEEYINKAEIIAERIKEIFDKNLSDSLSFDNIKKILEEND